MFFFLIRKSFFRKEKKNTFSYFRGVSISAPVHVRVIALSHQSFNFIKMFNFQNFIFHLNFINFILICAYIDHPIFMHIKMRGWSCIIKIYSKVCTTADVHFSSRTDHPVCQSSDQVYSSGDRHFSASRQCIVST